MAKSPEQPSKKVKLKKKLAEDGAAMPSDTLSGVLDVSPSAPPSWSWIQMSSETFSNNSIILSHDGMYFFVPSACSIRIHSTSTLKVVSTLSSVLGQSKLPSPSLTNPDYHTRPVTSVLLNPNNPFQLYSASLDGTIKMWDWLEGSLLRSFNFGLPIWHMCAHRNFPGTVFLHADVGEASRRLERNNAKASSRAFKVSLVATATENTPSPESIAIGKPVNWITGLAISSNGLWLGATSGTKAHIASTSRLRAGWSKFTSTSRLTCLAFHPNEEYFATGDEHGEIRLWYCLNDDHLSFEKLGVEKKAATSVFHWHAQAVRSIAFTPNGSYLLSGGLASVLVMWQIETGHKGFVPRVGAPINGISVVETVERGQEILLGLADSDLAMVSANTLGIRARAGLQFRATDTSHDPPILAVHPQRNWLITSSAHASSLQIYDPYATSIVTEFEVAPSNRIAATDSDYIIAPCKVTHAMFSFPDGRWLATIDAREATRDNTEMTTLKFWAWCQAKGRYELNTRADKPHGKSSVKTIHFGPAEWNGSGTLATAGSDGSVRLWGVKQVKTGKENENTAELWVQRGTITYRSLVPHCVAFSADNSLIAVVHDHCVTLWNSSGFVFRQVIASLHSIAPISSIMFLGKISKYLAVVGREGVMIWDLISARAMAKISTNSQDQPHWPATPPVIVQRPDANAFAVVGRTTEIWDLFKLRHLRKLVSPPFAIRAITSLNSSGQDFLVAAIAEDGRIYLMGDKVSLPEQEGTKERALKAEAHGRLSLFEDVFGRSAFKDLEETTDPTRQVRVDPVEFGAVLDLRLLDGPAYLLPPIETLYSSLIDGLLLKSREEQALDDPFGLKQDSEAMEVDGAKEVPDASSPPPAENSRVVDQAEIDMLVELFSNHCTDPPPISKASADVGIPVRRHKRPAEAGRPRPNGNIAQSKPSRSLLGSATSDDSSGTDASKPHVGQKRKVPRGRNH